MHKRSKIDLWVSLLIWFSIILVSITLFFIPSEERLFGLIIGVPLLITLLWIYFGSYFELRENILFCRIGPFYEKIPYEKIKSIRLSRSFLSSMALSRNRIEINQHGKSFITGTTYISPIDINEFFEALSKRCRNLENPN